jgi:hypothetical protein
MKVHKETIEVLIDLYTQSHMVLNKEYDAEREGEDAMEAAAMDYMSSPERARFCSIVDNLEDEVSRELIALMRLGREREDHSPEDFDRLKEKAAVKPDTGNYLFEEQRLAEHWRIALKMLNIE